MDASENSTFSITETFRQLADKKTSLTVLTRLELTFTIFEVLVAVCSVFGNSLIVASFLRNTHIRTATNLYVFSLAVADLLVSVVGIPIYLYSMITKWPSDYLACLIVNTWIMMLCTVSIFHLVAVSFDRYMAVVWLRQPDSRTERLRQAAFAIGCAWVCGTVVGFLPLMGWNQGWSPQRDVCEFMEIMDLSYLIFLFYATIIAPTILMAFFYVSIFYVVRRQDRRMARRKYSESESDRDSITNAAPRIDNASGEHNQTRCPSVKRKNDIGGRQYLTVENKHRRSETRQSLNESTASTNPQSEQEGPLGGLLRRTTMDKKAGLKKKATKSKRVIFSFALVILSFLTSWYPLYTLNAITYYAPDFRIDKAAFYACIILSHLSTTINPLIYARTMPGFKEVLVETLRCEKPGTRRKKQSIHLIDNTTLKNANTKLGIT